MKLRALALIALLCPLGTATAPSAANAAVWCNQIAIVGDSLTSLGNEALHDRFPEAIINAHGGRTTAQGYEAADGIDASNTVDCWVFALGTNDIYGWHDYASSRTAIDHLLRLVGPTDHVWWVLPQVTAASGLNAATFDSAVPTYADPVDLRTPLADFLPDGVHLTPTGYVHRAAALAAAIAG